MQTVLLISGASRGIGRAVALQAARAGRHLVLTGREQSQLEPVAAAVVEAGAQATVVPCDITAEPHVRRLVETAADISGQIDVLVNSAGNASITPFDELSLANWEHTLRVNLTGTFLLCKHSAAHMGTGGLIINIASIAARQAFPGWSAYSASKFGVVGFSNAMREELRPRGIRVSVVLPAATDTTLWDDLPGEWNRSTMLQPADVAGPVAHLLDQPPYMTTEELVVGHVAGTL